MQFLSRFSSSKSKDPSTKAHRRHSTPPSSTQQSTSYLPLDLPSSSLLRDDALSVPFGISSKSSRSGLVDREEDERETPSSRSVDTQPWVEITGQGEASPRMHPSENLTKDPKVKKEDPVKVRKEMVKLEKSRIGTEQMITLMKECGETIRSRGESVIFFPKLARVTDLDVLKPH